MFIYDLTNRVIEIDLFQYFVYLFIWEITIRYGTEFQELFIGNETGLIREKKVDFFIDILFL